MKVLILSTKLPWPARDGGAIASLNLAVGLAEAGVEVTFLTMNTSKHYFPADHIPGSIRDLIGIRTVDVDTRIRRIPLVFNYLFSTYPYIARRFISRDFKKEILKCLQESDYDIIQLEGPYLEGYITCIRRHSKARIVLRAHNLEHRIWLQMAVREKRRTRKNYLTNLAQRILLLESSILYRIDLLAPISEEDALVFREMNPEIPVHVCNAGLATGNYPVNEETDSLKLFYIGALDWGPNLQGLDWFFREVWPSLTSKWPELKLSLAGRNASAYPARATLPENVIMEGEPEDAIAFFQRYNVMLVPLQAGSGIRIKVLEAMVMGKIVVSTSTGASGLNAKAGEQLFIADTPEEFIRIIQILMDDPSIYKTMGTRARNFVIENFDNLAIVRNLVSFYKEHLR